MELVSSEPTTTTQQDPQSYSTESFEKKLEESRARVKTQTLEKIEKREGKKKRGRGRPRKHFPKPEISESILESSTTIENQPMGPQQTNVSNLIAPPLVFLSKIPANRLGVAEVALTADEAMLCAESLNAVLNAYIPDMEKMDPKTAAILGVCSTFGSVAFSKYSIYQSKVAEMRPQQDTQNAQNSTVEESRPQMVENGISPDSYFSKKNI